MQFSQAHEAVSANRGTSEIHTRMLHVPVGCGRLVRGRGTLPLPVPLTTVRWTLIAARCCLEKYPMTKIHHKTFAVLN